MVEAIKAIVKSGSAVKGVPEGVWHLKLYIAGQKGRSAIALANLRKICKEHLAGRCHIEVIDLQKHPGRAKTDEIVTLPALVRSGPGLALARKVVGDLSNTERVLTALELCLG